MTSIADIDTLIAALYPHVRQYRVDTVIHAPSSIDPNVGKCNAATSIYDIVDSFSELFHFYPNCESVAVAIQMPLRRKMSLYVCPSAPVPPGFDADAKDWFNQFLDTRTALLSVGLPDDESDRFIIGTYSRCYAKMRERVMGDDRWDSVVKPAEPKDEEERRLRDRFSTNLVRLSTLVESFADIMSRHPVDLEEDTLRFHALCLEIRDAVKVKEFEEYIDGYLHVLGVDNLLEYFQLPIAVFTLLSLPVCLDLSFDDECPIVVVDPASQGARNFTAILTSEHLTERFGSGAGIIDWDEVAKAFVEEETGRFSTGLEWNAPQRVLSTPAPITPHPEVVLLQHLLHWRDIDGDADQGQGGATIYVACSTTPCYATVLYSSVVNDLFKEQPEGQRLKVTMRTDDPDWCRLSSADPWILADGTGMEVVERLKDELVSEVEYLMDEWEMEKFRIGCESVPLVGISDG